MFPPRQQQGVNPHPQPHPQPHSQHPMGQISPQQGRWQPPLFTEKEDQLLQEILGSKDEAESLATMLKQSPPEIAALGYLIVRAFERSKSN